MKILDDILATIDYDATVRDIRVGPFQTAVLTRYCGLASTPHESGPHHTGRPVNGAGTLLERSARELAALSGSNKLYEAAIGMATINSLLEIDEDACQEINAADLIAEKGAGKNIAIIGHFPFVPALQKIARELWVIEKNPREGDRTEDESVDLVPRADVIGITGTAFTNHTMESLLELCQADAFVVVLGDTTPLLPVLFDYGIDAVCGTRVIDPEPALRCVSQGATYRQITGKQQLTLLK
jgi:uncharacterized protein